MAAFIRHENCEECGSSDGKAVYDDSSSHCFVCKHTKPSQEWIEQNSDEKPQKPQRVKPYRKEPMEVKAPASTKPAITQEEAQEIKKMTLTKCKGFRHIRDDITTMFGVRHSFNAEGEVVEQYYPTTQEGQLVGYKIREVPKDFRSVGRTGADCELFMQFKFNRGGKYVILVEGELCALSAYQMFSDYNKSRGSDFEVAVVSPTTGAQSKKQIAAQYKFFDSFEQIVLAFDNDKAGKEAADEVLKYLPKGKVKIMTMRYKDHNDYLIAEKQKEYISDFYNAKAYVPAGVVGSSELYDKLLESANVQKIPLPPFMKKLDEMLEKMVRQLESL